VSSFPARQEPNQVMMKNWKRLFRAKLGQLEGIECEAS
jgi:hypothetical protein